MKKLLLAFAIAISALAIKAQTVNGIPLDKIDVTYIDIVEYRKFVSDKVNIQLDYGQRSHILYNEERFVKDENGKDMEFNSMMDALNFLSKYGYEYIDSYVTRSKESSTSHFLLKRKEKPNENKPETTPQANPE
ncbi:MAG: hypothetical protein JW783_08485 [Bacteroidales bacterium]|nr:hypothetical protein [Bacteroidales bacterium]MBN2749978.1 hypothetical protein [Bacteroidales bacterium]